MRKLIDLIITEEEQEPLTLNLSENIKIKELIELLQHSTEEELKDFLNEFEKVIKRVSIDRLNRTREIFEFICTELKINYKIAAGKPSSSKLLQSKSTSHMNTNATINSPEKQSNGGSGGSRWTVPRDERRKILEQMERAREDQKRRKKKEWFCEEGTDEFEGIWNSFEQDQESKLLKESDLELMRRIEGIGMPPAPIPEAKRLRVDTSTSSLGPPKTLQNVPNYEIVDFDCIENVLISLTLSRAASSSISNAAKFILNAAGDIYKSDLMFYYDLKEFDQPNFLYYKQEDDYSALKYYKFGEDDLGNYSRNRTFQDRSRKFYKERAFRFRYISRKPYNLFFSNDALLNRLRAEIEYVKVNCDEFNYLISRSLSKMGTIFVTGNVLLKSFALLLVLSRTVEMSTYEISTSIWSHSKYGTAWTLMEILKKPGIPSYLTTEKESKLSQEAERMGIKFV